MLQAVIYNIADKARIRESFATEKAYGLNFKNYWLVSIN